MTAQHAHKIMHHKTGVVIPVYFPKDIDRTQGETLLRDTTTQYRTQIHDPANICLSVDGAIHGEEKD